MPLANVEARTTRIDCPNCAKTAETEIQRLEGVAGARVDLLNAKIYYSFDTSKTDPLKLRKQIEGLGHFKFVTEQKAKSVQLPFSRALGWSLLVSLVLYGIGALLQFAADQPALSTILFIIASLVGGWDILRRAFFALKHRRLDINVLMSLAIAGAIIIGDLHEAVVVVILFSFANLLESYSLWRLSKTLTKLSDFTSDQALLKHGKHTDSVSPDSLRVDDVVIIKEGARIPADGVIISGSSFIDLASLTGESQPRGVKVGDEVYAGSVNLDGYLEVRVTAATEDSRIGKILRLVGEASARKARVEKVIDRFAKVYTPIVVVLAALIATIPPVLLEASFETWFYRALVFLVISCPCALVISTPVAVTTALAAASRLKAVFRGGDALERLASIQTVVFDKTGTLTTGDLELKSIESLNGLGEPEVLQIAASIEQISQHPIARSIIAESARRRIEVLPVGEARSIPGIGVEGKVSGKLYQMRAANGTGSQSSIHGVMLSENSTPIARLVFSDQIRQEAATVVTGLRSDGISRIGVLSGDSQSSTESVASELSLDFAHGELLPDHKFQRIEALGEGVAMVGDGINDIVALSASDVSISLARFGNEIPAQHADIILFSNNLNPLPALVKLGKRTISTIKTNIVLAFAIKLIFLGLAAAGYANIWMAVLADMGASLLVIFNSLRLLRS